MGLLPGVHLNPQLLFALFLPPILFDAGINIKLALLKKQWIPITVFALLGTVLATVVAGGALIGLLIGGAASRITREYDDHLVEIMLTTVVAFGAYLAAEHFHVSGVFAVVAVFVGGARLNYKTSAATPGFDPISGRMIPVA